MSVGALVSKALLEVRADTSQARAELAKLERQEKQNAAATQKHQQAMSAQTAAMRRQLDAVEAHNKKLSAWAGGFGKVNLALQGLQAGFQVANAGWQAFARHADKAGGAAKETADKYREASKEWDEALNRILVFIGEFVAENHGLVSSLAATADAIASIAEATKQIPGIGGLLSDPRVTKVATGNIFQAWNDGTAYGDKQEQISLDGLSYGTPGETVSGGGGSDSYESAPWGKGGNGWTAERLRKLPDDDLKTLANSKEDPFLAYAAQRELFDREKKKPKKRARRGTPLDLDAIKDIGARIGMRPEAEDRRDLAPEYFESDRVSLDGGFGEQVYGLTAGAEAMQAGLEKRKNVLESVFGAPEEFDLYREKMEMLAGAFEVFSGALASGFNAWVSGSKSASEALKGLVGDTLKGLASQMFARAIEHGAAAIGALAWGGPLAPAIAAKHGKAAAMYGAGALLVGGMARAYGGAAGGGGGGAVAPTASGPSSSSGGGGSSAPVYIIMDSSINSDSQRQRQIEVGRAVRRARRFGNEGSGVIEA